MTFVSFRLVAGAGAEQLAAEELGQAAPKKRRPGPRRHDKYQGLKRYTDGSWGLDCILFGKRKREKVGKFTEAKQLYDDLKAAERRGEVVVEPEKPVRRTLKECLESYVSIPRGKTNTEFVAKWIRAIGRLYPEQFTLELLREWAHERLAAGAEIASVRRMMDPLRACYTEIIRAGDILAHQNPFRDPKALALPKINNKRDSYVQFDKVPALICHFGPTWWPYAEFAVVTTMRFSNQKNLRWDDIDWQAKIAILRRTKNGLKFHIRLSDLAVQLLKEQKARLDAAGIKTEWCWPNSKGGQLNSAHFRQRVWGPAFEAADLKVMGRGRHGLTWHDLSRHTAAVWLSQLGENPYVLQELMNHADFRTTERYTFHSKDDQVRQAMERLANLVRLATAGRMPFPGESVQSVNSASVAPTTGVDESRRERSPNPALARFSPN